MVNVVAASVEYSRATCSASMQHVSEQKENKVSWLDQLGSWWDKNRTTIITGVMVLAIGTVAVMTVVATAGTALPILAATSSTLAALAGATVATAGSMAMMTGTASILSTLPGLDKVYGPTVNTAGFQELQMVSVVVASMGTAYLWQLDSVAQSANAQTPKTQEQTSTKVKEEITGTRNTVSGNAGQAQGTESDLDEGTADIGEYASSSAQYQRLKESLAKEEIQSVVETTEHGAERLMSRGFTPSEISEIKLSPSKIMTQTDGASVYIKDIGSGKYNIIVEGESGVITALKNIGQSSLDRLSKNYGWQ